MQMPWMACIVPFNNRMEVLMAGVVGWASEGGSWGPSTMARAFHEALGIYFESADPRKYMDTLLYGLTMAWGTEVTSFNLSP